MNNSGSDHRFLNDALTLEEAERAERAEWLQWRRGGLGGSDIAGVLGLSPWSSPWSVWADKVINRSTIAWPANQPIERQVRRP